MEQEIENCEDCQYGRKNIYSSYLYARHQRIFQRHSLKSSEKKK